MYGSMYVFLHYKTQRYDLGIYVSSNYQYNWLSTCDIVLFCFVVDCGVQQPATVMGDAIV